VTVISFKPEDIHFLTDHISQATLKRLLTVGKTDKMEMVEQYTRELLDAPENRLVKKTNMRSVHSKVHVGNNKWHTKHDKDVYPTLLCNVASQFNEMLNAAGTLTIDRRTLKDMERFLDYMCDNGYCSDDSIGPEMAATFRSLVQRIKAVVHDVTNADEEAMTSV
jgi:hypothetical protein